MRHEQDDALHVPGRDMPQSVQIDNGRNRLTRRRQAHVFYECPSDEAYSPSWKGRTVMGRNTEAGTK